MPITAAADNIKKYLFSFSEKIRLEILCQLPARVGSTHEISSLSFSKKKMRMLSATILHGTSRVKVL